MSMTSERGLEVSVEKGVLVYSTNVSRRTSGTNKRWVRAIASAGERSQALKEKIIENFGAAPEHLGFASKTLPPRSWNNYILEPLFVLSEERWSWQYVAQLLEAEVLQRFRGGRGSRALSRQDVVNVTEQVRNAKRIMNSEVRRQGNECENRYPQQTYPRQHAEPMNVSAAPLEALSPESTVGIVNGASTFADPLRLNSVPTYCEDRQENEETFQLSSILHEAPDQGARSEQPPETCEPSPPATRMGDEREVDDSQLSIEVGLHESEPRDVSLRKVLQADWTKEQDFYRSQKEACREVIRATKARKDGLEVEAEKLERTLNLLQDIYDHYKEKPTPKLFEIGNSLIVDHHEEAQEPTYGEAQVDTTAQEDTEIAEMLHEQSRLENEQRLYCNRLEIKIKEIKQQWKRGQSHLRKSREVITIEEKELEELQTWYTKRKASMIEDAAEYLRKLREDTPERE